MTLTSGATASAVNRSGTIRTRRSMTASREIESPARANPTIMSFFHPELSQGPARFDRPGRGSFRWFRELFEHLRDTALPTASASQPGNDQALSRGAQGGERVVFHVVQAQDGLDHRGTPLRVAAQLGGQDFPVFQPGVAAFADAAELGLEPVRGPLRGCQVLPARLAAAGDHRLVPAEIAQVGEHADHGGEDRGDASVPRCGDVHGRARLAVRMGWDYVIVD